MRYATLQRFLPLFFRNYVLDFEASIERAVSAFAAALPKGARVLDAGAGEGQYNGFFRDHRYIGVDFALGDANWDYSSLDAVADLHALPFRDECFDACFNIVTLEHVREPACVLREIARTLKRGGRLLLVVPQDWEVHQSPHDYFRFTRYGVRYLLENAGFTAKFLTMVAESRRLDWRPGTIRYSKDDEYDRLAAIAREHLDVERICSLIQ